MYIDDLIAKYTPGEPNDRVDVPFAELKYIERRYGLTCFTSGPHEWEYTSYYRKNLLKELSFAKTQLAKTAQAVMERLTQ